MTDDSHLSQPNSQRNSDELPTGAEMSHTAQLMASSVELFKCYDYRQSDQSTPSTRPLSDILHGAMVLNGTVFGPITNLFKWLHSQYNAIEQRDLENRNLSTTVFVALNKEEQNMEIVYQNGQYYFEVLRNFRINLRKTTGIGGGVGDDERPRAWFSADIETKLLLKPAKSWLNGTEIFYCLMCNHFSTHAHHIILHMMFCEKIETKCFNDSLDSDLVLKHSVTPAQKPRSFDIISLLKNDQEDCVVVDGDNINEEEEEEDVEEEVKIDVESLEEECSDKGPLVRMTYQLNCKQNRTNRTKPKGIKVANKRKYTKSAQLKGKTGGKSAFKKPKTESDLSQSESKGNLITNLAHLYSQFSGNGAGTFVNAFQKPNGNNFLTDSGVLFPPNSYPFISQNMSTSFKFRPEESNKFMMMNQLLLQSVNKINDDEANCSPKRSSPVPRSLSLSQSPTMLDTSSPSSTSSHNCESPKLEQMESKGKQTGGQSTSKSNTTPNGSIINLPPYFMPPTSVTNPLISSLYLLSPSLTALSYQASNVCAYCNTAFRMTSDLVYHMRSHHKNTTQDVDCSKKRKDDQLRCNICNETFRERHHLTRHMTSHQ